MKVKMNTISPDTDGHICSAEVQNYCIHVNDDTGKKVCDQVRVQRLRWALTLRLG